MGSPPTSYATNAFTPAGFSGCPPLGRGAIVTSSSSCGSSFVCTCVTAFLLDAPIMMRRPASGLMIIRGTATRFARARAFDPSACAHIKVSVRIKQRRHNTECVVPCD